MKYRMTCKLYTNPIIDDVFLAIRQNNYNLYLESLKQLKIEKKTSSNTSQIFFKSLENTNDDFIITYLKLFGFVTNISENAYFNIYNHKLKNNKKIYDIIKLGEKIDNLTYGVDIYYNFDRQLENKLSEYKKLLYESSKFDDQSVIDDDISSLSSSINFNQRIKSHFNIDLSGQYN